MNFFLSSIVLFYAILATSFLHAEITFKSKKFIDCTDQEINMLAQMRITYFREYPYLYEGTIEYEINYLGEYKQRSLDAYLIQAFDGDQLVGILTGCAFASDIDVIRDGAKIFEMNGFPIQEYYYIGEAIIIPEYQNQKILPRLLYQLVNEVKKLNRYESLCFLTVVRQDNDSRKPVNYRSTDNLWEKLGCQRVGVKALFEWPTIMDDNSVQNIFNEVEFWTYTPGLSGYAQLVKFMAQQGFIASKKTLRDAITDCLLAGFNAWNLLTDFF